MKKILSLALLGLALSANAQNYQIPNSDFSNWASDKEPGNGWYSFNSAGGSLSSMKGSSPAPSKDTDRLNNSNSHSCKIYSKSVLGIAKANGNLTTGKINMGNASPANASNYNYTERSGSNCLLFAGRPDAVEFWAKFTSGGSPNGRGQFIIHDDVDYRDPESDEQAGNRVGKASVLIPASTDWTHYTGEFTYDKERTSTQYMLASFTTNPTPGGSANDYLWIDDVNLIYYHSISDVKYGETALNFTKTSAESAAYEVYRCDMSTITYDAAQTITYTLKGVAATVNKSYNEQTGLLTITVKGDDYAVNSNSKTVYEVQFDAPDYTGLLSGLKVNDNVISTFSEDNLFYTVVGDYTEGCIEATTKGADDNADVMYDGASRIAYVIVSGGDNSNIYYVKFAREATEYTGKMIIDMDGMFLSASNSPVGISTPIDGKVDFQLLNFSLEGLGLIGDIFVTDVAYGEPVNGVVNFSKVQTINIFGAMGMALGDLPVTLTGKVENGEMTAQINITWNDGVTDHPIIVNVYPFSTSSIDLQDAAGAGEFISAVKEGLTNKNALIYVAENETVNAENADNVVVGSTCENFTLTEGQAFKAPKAFTATKVTYDRTLTAGNLQTFVLPFSFTPGENDLVAALESVEGSVLTFKPIEGATEANKPYLIQTENASALASFDNVTIEPTTGDLTTTVDGVSHIGSYSELTVTDAYGYADGQFVQAGTGTVKPFRTYITIPAGSAAAPKAFDIHFADTETGIATVVTDSKDQNVYNLQGVRVAHSLNGLTKGIYIVNGKKTVIK